MDKNSYPAELISLRNYYSILILHHCYSRFEVLVLVEYLDCDDKDSILELPS